MQLQQPQLKRQKDTPPWQPFAPHKFMVSAKQSPDQKSTGWAVGYQATATQTDRHLLLCGSRKSSTEQGTAQASAHHSITETEGRAHYHPTWWACPWGIEGWMAARAPCSQNGPPNTPGTQRELTTTGMVQPPTKTASNQMGPPPYWNFSKLHSESCRLSPHP